MPSDPAEGRRPAAAPPAVLSPVREVFRAVVLTVVPEAGHLDEPGWRDLEALVEQALADRPPDLQRQLRFFLRVIQAVPLLRYGRRFTALDAPRRARVLTYLEDHSVERIRCGLWGLRTLAFLGYYGRQEGAREIGYAADRRGWEALR